VTPLLRRAAATAAATVLGVSLLVAAKSGPGGRPAALAQPGVVGRPPVARGPVATAPPLPEATTSTTVTAPAPVPPSSTSTTAAPPPAPTTAPTARPTPSSAPPTTRPPARPAPAATTATTARPTTTSAPATTATEPAAAPPPPSTAPGPTTTTTAAPGTTTVDSPIFVAAHGRETYGNVQVRLTFQGHRIVDAVALQTPSDRAKSRQINQRAVPILRQEVLDAQSAQIDTVSGATATSEAYAQCVQAILDQVWK